MNLKSDFREALIKKRHAIPSSRRKEARKKVLAELYPRLKSFSKVLSFASKEEEIDLWPLNIKLAREERLALLYTEDNWELTPYLVSEIEKQLKVHSKWKVREPIPHLCSVLPLDRVGAVLVPGIGFDKRRHRLGYGKGYYDRFLTRLNCPCYGVGFQEQLLDVPIQTEGHDVSLTDVFLF